MNPFAQSMLFQNYPNPFNPTTIISYRLSAFCNVKLAVYDAFGQKIKTLVDCSQTAGGHYLVWDGTDDNNNTMSPGIYFYKLETNQQIYEKKMMLIR